jgi:hypothetical protein
LGTWAVLAHQKNFFDELASEIPLDPNILEHWKKVSVSRVLQKEGGKQILRHYSNSLIKALKAIYPRTVEQSLRSRTRKPNGYWNNIANQKDFLQSLADELGIDTSKPEQWSQIKKEDVLKRGGSGLIAEYGNSLTRALETIYPNFALIQRKKEDGYWKVEENQKNFFDQLAADLGIDVNQTNHWYNISAKDIINKGGKGLLKHYNGSHIRALQNIYKELEWFSWHFQSVGKKFWNQEKNVLAYMTWVSSKLGITQLDDWYSISTDLIQHFHGKPLLQKHGGLFQLLTMVYPNHPWDLGKYQRTAKEWGKSQWHLYLLVKKLLLSLGHPGVEAANIHMNYRHPDLRFKDTAHRMELDIFIPPLNLAFEYQVIDKGRSEFTVAGGTALQRNFHFWRNGSIA